MGFVTRVVAASFTLAAQTAHAESSTILGRTLNLTPPAGFCQLGNSPVERELEVFQRQNTSPAGELAQMAVLCSELSSFKAGKTENFTQWVQVLVLKQKGQLKTVSTPRATFVRGVAGRLADSPPDMQALAERTREHLAKTGYAATSPSAVPIGATQDAAFLEVRMTATVGSWSSPVAAVVAITVANQLPLGIYTFATPMAKGESPAEITRKYLRQVIDQN